MNCNNYLEFSQLLSYSISDAVNVFRNKIISILENVASNKRGSVGDIAVKCWECLKVEECIDGVELIL